MAKAKPLTEEEAAMATVRVTGQPVCEDGVHYAKGDTFQTTQERAEALAGLTEIVATPAE